MSKRMDPILVRAIRTNDTKALINLLRHNQSVLAGRDAWLNTPLHLATRFGHIELVTEIIKLCPPGLVSAENEKQETPLHEACLHGKAEAARMLLETNPIAATKVNHEGQTAFSLACRQGHLDVVKLMLKQSWLIEFEEDCVGSTPLHAAISGGHLDIVKEILKVHPNSAETTNNNGFSSLHCASSRGNLEVTKLLLKLDPNLALKYDNNGYTPLHLAAINGHVKILEAFLMSSPTSFKCLTAEGETVFHLATRFDKYNAFVCLAESFSFTSLLHRQDQFGNTVLHLAVLKNNSQLAEYIINKTTVDINCQNYKLHTALDVLELSGSGNSILERTLKAAGIRAIRPSAPTPEVKEIDLKLTLENPKHLIKETMGVLALPVKEENSSQYLLKHQFGKNSEIQNDRESQAESRKDIMDCSTNWHQCHHLSKSCGSLPVKSTEQTPTKDSPEHTPKWKSKVREANSSEPQSSEEAKVSPNNLQRHKDLSRRHMKELSARYKSRQNKKNEIHREALQNARNTIILVAILIATVTFAAGISPPGGVYQDGPQKGKSTVGRTTAFKVFEISNNIALFTSLSIVIILVSIIPFERKKLMRLLVITHKLMWVSISFMATAYIAATRITVPLGRGTGWMTDTLLAMSAGTLGFLFVYLGVELTRHWLRKLKWRAENGRKQGKFGVIRGRIQLHSRFRAKNETQSESTNSDVDSSTSIGYYAY
ncbi:Ankyrin repeat-containing protein [Melia azedarach]|uniref:Ankyrin repeat-containing protein n=1 Tax=Melia azedarach TaxID=155640 RepID=A0ACC1Y503_MELAZ|nr:Ankyrin repeat-containing protein [Melia azedarach]